MRIQIEGASTLEKFDALTALIAVCKLAARDVCEGLTVNDPEDAGSLWKTLNLAEALAYSVQYDLPDDPIKEKDK